MSILTHRNTHISYMRTSVSCHSILAWTESPSDFKQTWLLILTQCTLSSLFLRTENPCSIKKQGNLCVLALGNFTSGLLSWDAKDSILVNGTGKSKQETSPDGHWVCVKPDFLGTGAISSRASGRLGGTLRVAMSPTGLQELSFCQWCSPARSAFFFFFGLWIGCALLL